MAATHELPPGPRSIRQLRRPDAAWDGLLADDEHGARCMLVDVGELVDDVVWQATTGGHLAAVTDLVRTADGHLAVLPVCTQRLEEFVARRREGGMPLSVGEAVTLTVSVLRAAAELVTILPASTCGSWWLSEDGRPLLVGGGGDPALEAAAALVGLVCRDLGGEAVRALTHVGELLDEPRRLERETADAEAELFAVAEAEPLATAVLAPVRARRVAVTRASTPVEPGREGHWWNALAAHVDGTLPDLVSRAATALWRRVREDRPRGRVRPLVIAASVAAVVLGAGLMWPQGADEPATAETRHPPRATAEGRHPFPTAGSKSPPFSSHVPTPSRHAASTAVSLEEVAANLLDRRDACDDAGCRGATQEDPDAVFTGGSPAGRSRSVHLLDDYGGAAVLRVDSEGAGPQLVVIVAHDGRWLLRDIRDVAEQPSR